MHILFISRWFPYPPDNGSKIRISSLIQQLSKNHEITLLSFCQGKVSQEHLAAMETWCRTVRTVPYKEFNPRGLKALLGFFQTRPRYIIDTYSPEMERLVREAHANNDFDVVIASEMAMTLYALWLDLPRVLDDLELTVFYDRYAQQRSLTLKLRHKLTWWKLARFIAQALPQFDGCTITSDYELELLTSIAPGYDPLIILPNGVDLETNTGDFGAPRPDTLIYPGALTYDANFDAVKFFLDDIFPLIQAQRPTAKLRITGRYDGVPLQELPIGNDAQLTGYLEDIRPAVAQSWGCVVPLRIGSGTRLKILQAMALNTPVVATSKGAEGLAVTHGENILIADSPGDFAQAVLDLLEDEHLRARLAANGRRLVQERYAWEKCVRPLEQLIARIAGKQADG